MCCDRSTQDWKTAAYLDDVAKSLAKKLRVTTWVVDMLKKNGLLNHICAPVDVDVCVSKQREYNARIAGEALAAKFLLLYAQDPTVAWKSVSLASDGDTVRLKIVSAPNYVKARRNFR